MTLNNDEIINSLKGKVPHLKLKKKTNNNCIRAKYSLLTKTLTIKLKKPPWRFVCVCILVPINGGTIYPKLLSHQEKSV